MDIVLLIVLVVLTGIASAILYLNIKSKPKNENKEAEEIANLKSEITNLKDTLNTTINNSLGSMSTSFNALSTGVTKDMTETLTKVEEKVGSFNQQVQLLNQSQEG
jgi:DNA recombination protein RmuC